MRLHLFEWEDQAWFPDSLRAAMTSYLVTVYGITPLPRCWADCLSKFLSRDEVNEIVDLGSVVKEPVDAARVPAALSGIRTMFASFHHFPPAAALGILRDAFEQGRPICIFEGTSRTPAAIASALLIPFMVLLLTPLVRPVSPVQILFTYLVPILPLLMFWDGFVSHLRTYSVQELAEFTRDLQSPRYRWEAGLIEIPRMPGGVPYLIGWPA